MAAQGIVQWDGGTGRWRWDRLPLHRGVSDQAVIVDSFGAFQLFSDGENAFFEETRRADARNLGNEPEYRQYRKDMRQETGRVQKVKTTNPCENKPKKKTQFCFSKTIFNETKFNNDGFWVEQWRHS